MKRTIQSSKKGNFRNAWLEEMADYKRRIMLQRGVVAMKRHYLKKPYSDTDEIPALQIGLYNKIAKILDARLDKFFKENWAIKVPADIGKPELKPAPLEIIPVELEVPPGHSIMIGDEEYPCLKRLKK